MSVCNMLVVDDSPSIHKLIITHQLFLFNPGAVRVTCSLGVAESRQWEGSLLQAAEQALFDARLAGGNRVVLNEALVSRADALRLTN